MNASANPGWTFEQRHLRRPLLGDGRRHQKAVAAVADRRLEQLLERQLAELGVQLDPRRHAPGTVTEFQPSAGTALPPKYSGVQRRGRAARGVQAVQLLAVPDDGEGVRADAVGHRLHHRQRDRGGEGRVHRAAALGEHPQARLRGERLRGAHDVCRQDRLSRPGVGEVPTERRGHVRERNACGDIDGAILRGGVTLRPSLIARRSGRQQRRHPGQLGRQLRAPELLALCPPGEKPPAGGLGSCAMNCLVAA